MTLGVTKRPARSLPNSKVTPATGKSTSLIPTKTLPSLIGQSR